jgi:uncharacterized protein involved in oxidation of intracellular sulfur
MFVKTSACQGRAVIPIAIAEALLKTLFILNDAPYGSERPYNGLRLAGSLAKASGEEAKVFLMGDAIACAKSGQKVPEGFYNIQLMLGRVARSGAEVGACGTCMDARGIVEAELIEGSRRSTLAELTAWTQWADKVIVF